MPGKIMRNGAEKKKIGLVFTLDYEIHGNGHGDFYSWAYFPTSHMLDVFDLYGAKLTIMAEMGHYWAMKRFEHLFSTDIQLFESQLQDAVKRGHDVQLHFHPQWIDAKLKDGNWHLDYSRTTIERLCNNYEEAFFYLTKGKKDLENLLIPFDPKYQCICFRAGYLQMQPSKNIIQALTNAGFVSDSSVQKGTVADNKLRVLDYSDAYSRYMPWKVSPLDICKRDDTGQIVEFPILTERRILNKISKRIRRVFSGKRIHGTEKIIPAFLSKGMPGKNANEKVLLQNITKIIEAKSWDYVDFCRRDNKYLINSIENVISESKNVKSVNYIPLVLIGHSKDFFFSNHLSVFLDICKGMEEIEFDTYSEAVKKYSITYEK